MLGYSRRKIRDNLVSALTGITTVGSRVVSGNAEPSIGLPNITYYIDTEELDPGKSSFVSDDDPSQRAIRIVVEGRAETKDGSDAPIDDLCLEIEKVIATGSTLNDWCRDLRLDNTAIEMEENNIPVALATLEYFGIYSEPETVSVSNVVYTKTQTSITASFKTNVRGLGTLEANNFVGGTKHYSEQETIMSNSHSIVVTGLTAGTNYLMSINFESGAYGYDLTGYTTTMFDGVTSPIQATLP